MNEKESKRTDKSSTSLLRVDHKLNTLIKINTKILSQFSNCLTRLEILEDLFLEFNQKDNKQHHTTYEPIRGIKGLAQFLGVSHVTAQKIKNSGKIPYAQYERVILFDPIKVLAALETKNNEKQ